MIIAINVKHFVSLDTEDSAIESAGRASNRRINPYPESTHSVKPASAVGVSCCMTITMNKKPTCAENNNIVFGGDFIHYRGTQIRIDTGAKRTTRVGRSYRGRGTEMLLAG